MADYSDTTVIIPTLNEEGSIGKLLKQLLKMYAGIHIIVADDGSTDSTIVVVRRIMARHSRVKFLDRSAEKKHGITASVIDASLIVNTKKIVVMDGDMQHPPEKVGKLIKALDQSDIAIGCRTRIRKWGFHRKILSKGITLIAVASFKLRGKRTTSDMMSGFFGIRTRLLGSIVAGRRSEFVDTGYKVLLDILRVAGNDVKISEVPYSTFHDRTKGRSKFKPRHMVTTLVSALR
jgi:dolichol-phosphate mannosyltransferase